MDCRISRFPRRTERTPAVTGSNCNVRGPQERESHSAAGVALPFSKKGLMLIARDLGGNHRRTGWVRWKAGHTAARSDRSPRPAHCPGRPHNGTGEAGPASRKVGTRLLEESMSPRTAAAAG